MGMSRALLIIDVQESFRQAAIWRTVSDPKIADHLVPVVQAARTAGDEVIWILHSEPGTGSTFIRPQGSS
jgi:nicotinamidase-related amidase